MLILSILHSTNAQNCRYTLEGKVTDYHDGTALADASILIVGQEKVTVSGVDGTYSFKGLCPGTYELEVSHPDCATTFIPVTIEGNTSFAIKLEHHLEELQEVKVFGDAVFDKTNSAIEGTLKANTLEKYSASNLGDALKELGGVASLNTGANIAKPTIHGLNGSRVSNWADFAHVPKTDNKTFWKKTTLTQ